MRRSRKTPPDEVPWPSGARTNRRLYINVIQKLEAKMNENHYYRRGEIYIADLDPSCGSEQGGVRPVVILQNNAGNYFCPTLIVAPITSRVYKKPN